MSRVFLYGMSFRHPKAFAVMNKFAKMHEDVERAFSALLAWQELLDSLSEQTLTSKSFVETDRYSKALENAIKSRVVSFCVLHDFNITVVFRSSVYASALAGLKSGSAAVFSRDQCKDLRPFGDERAEVVGAEYTRSLA